MSGDGIPQEETYNFYGDDAVVVEIKAIEDHIAFIMVLSKDVPRDGVCVNGVIVYTATQEPSKEGHIKTESYVDDHRMLGDRFCAKVFRRRLRGDSSAPIAKLKV